MHERTEADKHGKLSGYLHSSTCEFVNTFLDHAWVDIKLFTQQQEEKEKNERKKKTKEEKKEEKKEKTKKKKSRVNFLPIISSEKYLFVAHTRRINPRSLLFTSKYSCIFLLFIEQTNPDRNSQCRDEGKSSSDVELKLVCHHYLLYTYTYIYTSPSHSHIIT